MMNMVMLAWGWGSGRMYGTWLRFCAQKRGLCAGIGQVIQVGRTVQDFGYGFSLMPSVDGHESSAIEFVDIFIVSPIGFP